MAADSVRSRVAALLHLVATSVPPVDMVLDVLPIVERTLQDALAAVDDADIEEELERDLDNDKDGEREKGEAAPRVNNLQWKKRKLPEDGLDGDIHKVRAMETTPRSSVVGDVRRLLAVVREVWTDERVAPNVAPLLAAVVRLAAASEDAVGATQLLRAARAVMVRIRKDLLAAEPTCAAALELVEGYAALSGHDASRLRLRVIDAFVHDANKTTGERKYNRAYGARSWLNRLEYQVQQVLDGERDEDNIGPEDSPPESRASTEYSDSDEEQEDEDDSDGNPTKRTLAGTGGGGKGPAAHSDEDEPERAATAQETGSTRTVRPAAKSRPDPNDAESTNVLEGVLYRAARKTYITVYQGRLALWACWYAVADVVCGAGRCAEWLPSLAAGTVTNVLAGSSDNAFAHVVAHTGDVVLLKRYLDRLATPTIDEDQEEAVKAAEAAAATATRPEPGDCMEFFNRLCAKALSCGTFEAIWSAIAIRFPDINVVADRWAPTLLKDALTYGNEHALGIALATGAAVLDTAGWVSIGLNAGAAAARRVDWTSYALRAAQRMLRSASLPTVADLVAAWGPLTDADRKKFCTLQLPADIVLDVVIARSRLPGAATSGVPMVNYSSLSYLAEEGRLSTISLLNTSGLLYSPSQLGTAAAAGHKVPGRANVLEEWRNAIWKAAKYGHRTLAVELARQALTNDEAEGSPWIPEMKTDAMGLDGVHLKATTPGFLRILADAGLDLAHPVCPPWQTLLDVATEKQWQRRHYWTHRLHGDLWAARPCDHPSVGYSALVDWWLDAGLPVGPGNLLDALLHPHMVVATAERLIGAIWPPSTQPAADAALDGLLLDLLVRCDRRPVRVVKDPVRLLLTAGADPLGYAGATLKMAVVSDQSPQVVQLLLDAAQRRRSHLVPPELTSLTLGAALGLALHLGKRKAVTRLVNAGAQPLGWIAGRSFLGYQGKLSDFALKLLLAYRAHTSTDAWRLWPSLSPNDWPLPSGADVSAHIHLAARSAAVTTPAALVEVVRAVSAVWLEPLKQRPHDSQHAMRDGEPPTAAVQAVATAKRRTVVQRGGTLNTWGSVLADAILGARDVGVIVEYLNGGAFNWAAATPAELVLAAAAANRRDPETEQTLLLADTLLRHVPPHLQDMAHGLVMAMLVRQSRPSPARLSALLWVHPGAVVAAWAVLCGGPCPDEAAALKRFSVSTAADVQFLLTLDSARLLDRTAMLVALCKAAEAKGAGFAEDELPQAIGHLLAGGADGSAALARMVAQLSVPGHPAVVLQATLTKRAFASSPQTAAAHPRTARASGRGRADRGRRFAAPAATTAVGRGAPGDGALGEALAHLVRTLVGVGDVTSATALLPRIRSSTDGLQAARLLQSVADAFSTAGYTAQAQELQRDVERIAGTVPAPSWAPANTSMLPSLAGPGGLTPTWAPANTTVVSSFSAFKFSGA